MKYSLLFFIFCISNAAECNLQKTLRATSQIIKKKSAKKSAHLGLTRTTELNGVFSKPLLDILKSLTDLPDYLHSYQSMLMLSATLFFHVPGYAETLRLVTDTHSGIMIKGHAYEIEHAIKLYKEGDEILHFNKVLTDGKTSREIDIHTDKRMVECKNVAWRNNPHKLKKQFTEQQRLVEHFNRENSCSCLFQVSSKQPIPPVWKVWFAQHEINIHEGS